MSFNDDPQLHQEVDGLSVANRNLRSISRKSTRWTRASVTVLAVIVLGAFAASGFALFDRFSSGEQRRNEQIALNNRFRKSDQRQTEAIRAVLCLAAKQVATSKQRTPEEKRIAAKFYREALMKIHALPCPQIKV